MVTVLLHHESCLENADLINKLSQKFNTKNKGNLAKK